MSAYCPHANVVGRCPFGCTVLWAGRGWVGYHFGAAPASWIARRDSRRRRSLGARIARAAAHLQRAVA